MLAAPRRDGAAVGGETRCMETADELKQELAAARVGGGRLFPMALRQRALEYAAQREKAGATVSAIARELGVKPGRIIGEVLASLLEEVTAEPSLNVRDTLLDRARAIVAEKGN